MFVAKTVVKFLTDSNVIRKTNNPNVSVVIHTAEKTPRQRAPPLIGQPMHQYPEETTRALQCISAEVEKDLEPVRQTNAAVYEQWRQLSLSILPAKVRMQMLACSPYSS